MISLPDELLERIDREAERRGETRSGLLRRVTEDALEDLQEWRRQEMRKLNAHAGHYGGNSLELLKAGRPKPK